MQIRQILKDTNLCFLSFKSFFRNIAEFPRVKTIAGGCERGRGVILLLPLSGNAYGNRFVIHPLPSTCYFS